MALFGRKTQRLEGPVRPTSYEFAVVDVETTGLDRQSDRMIEIAVVLADISGNITYEWTTLVNSEAESAGPTAIHGITDDMVAVAPPFSKIAGDLAYLLTNRLIVAHNASFDVAFIEQAFFRAGTPLAQDGLSSLDTMEIAERLGLPRKLGTLCAELGVFYDPHNALDDARVTLEVLRKFLPRIDPSSFVPANPSAVFEAVNAPQGAPLLSRTAAADLLRPRDLVAESAFRFHPVDAAPDAVGSYQAAVRRQLASGVFTAEIGAEMVSVAIEGRLSAAQTRDVHHETLCELFDSALSDNRVTRAERLAIETAAAWLGVALGDFDTWVKAARVRRKEAVKEFRSGLRVCAGITCAV